VDAREDVSGGLFVAGCDGAKVLDDVEEMLKKRSMRLGSQ
jgi:hypothetical protein